MARLKHAWLAVRPQTLSISVTPVLVGTSLAWAESGLFHWQAALAALTAALLIQAGTNLHNDVADFERGADPPDRLGPPRATAQAWFTGAQIRRGARLCFAAAFAIGIYLAWVGGWPIVAIGLLSLLAGFAYTGGPSPIAYGATGELFVFLFFGLAAVMGSYYIQTLTWSLNGLAAAFAIGMLAAAILLVNNYRDLDTDRQARKLTLVHRLGEGLSRYLYGILLLAPFLLPAFLEVQGQGYWLVLGVLPFALVMVRRFFRKTRGPGFNRILAATARLQLAFGVVLSLGLFI